MLGTKVAPFPKLMWGVVFTACVVFLFFSFLVFSMLLKVWVAGGYARGAHSAR